ncbi:MAG: efflux RND transporter periplasmic adaptor subunit [Desulfuromonadales bacterium]
MTRFFVLLIMLLTITACGERIEPGRTSVEPVAVSGLTTTVVEPSAVQARYVLPATVESSDRGLLTARLSGQVARILVSEGQVVQSGTSMLVLEGETATSELKTAEGMLTAAERQLDEAETYQKLAEATYTRYLMLRDAQAVTPHEFDKVVADRDAALQRHAAARAALAVSRAQRDTARVMANQATVKAPYDATVAEVLVDAGSTVLPGTPLFHLDRSGPWLVRVALPESLASGHKPGDSFQVEIPPLKKELTGRLTEMLPAADPGSRTITAWLTLPEDAALHSGLFARVFMPEDAGMTTLMVPSAAVVTRGQLKGVYVVEDNVLNYRLVQTGTVHADQVEIISGLRAGEEIIAADLARARHGARLERNR